MQRSTSDPSRPRSGPGRHWAPSARHRARRRQALGRWATAATASLAAVGLTLGVATAGSEGGPGRVVAMGGAPALGSAPGHAVTGMARTPSGQGYWLVTGSGAVFSFGDAAFAGALPGGGGEVADIAATADGGGYWLVTTDGAVHSFGTAADLGSLAGRPLSDRIVAIAATPSGQGYWLAGGDGGVFAFGDAGYFGSTGDLRLRRPVVGMSATPTGQGYWLVGGDGGVFTFGDARFVGSTGGRTLNEPVVGMAATPSGQGYWLAGRDGGVFTFGDAAFHGSLAGSGSGPVVDLEATPDGSGQWLTTGARYLGDFVVTCYALGGTTASGRPVSPEGVAVDPAVVPLGSEIFIAGEGSRTATDTGGDIQGRRIDIWKPSAADCRSFGRQTLAVFSAS